MINLGQHGGISFKKGCYVGQEIIARTEHLGKLKRHLHKVQLQATTTPKAGDEIKNADGESLGVIVQAAHTSPRDCECLAVIQQRAIEAQQTLLWENAVCSIVMPNAL